MAFSVRHIVLLVPLLHVAAAGISVARDRNAEASGSDAFEGYRLLRIWTNRDGLPNNSVTSLAQTDDGFLWIGTRGGLVRFDGVEFQTYLSRSRPGLLRNRIEALVTDAEGNLWIGHDELGISCWRAGRFRAPSLSKGDPVGAALGLPQPPMDALVGVGKGRDSSLGTPT